MIQSEIRTWTNAAAKNDSYTRSTESADLRILLIRAGFRIRTSKRADCVHCSGRSRGTVSYNRDVAHCFRCGWAANIRILARHLGLPDSDPRKYLKLQEDAIRRARTEKMINVFEAWRQPRICHVSNRFRHLGRVAVRAEEVLRSFPDCDPAWGALALYYHQTARLSAALDFLCFTKASVWLEIDSTPAEVFSMWRSNNVIA